MMVETTVVQQLADAVQRGDAGALAELYAEDAVLHHPLSPTPVEGRQAIQESEQRDYFDTAAFISQLGP
jgi:ketosteroid isomerase-like protein